MTISNLFPRPDRPALGVFNAQLFERMGRMVPLGNVCLAMEVDRAAMAARHGKRSWDVMAHEVLDVMRQAGANL